MYDRAAVVSLHCVTGDTQRMAAGGAEPRDLPATSTDVERAAIKSDVQASLSNFTFIKVLGKGSFGKV